MGLEGIGQIAGSLASLLRQGYGPHGLNTLLTTQTGKVRHFFYLDIPAVRLLFFFCHPIQLAIANLIYIHHKCG